MNRKLTSTQCSFLGKRYSEENDQINYERLFEELELID